MATISTTAILGQQSDPLKPNRFGPFFVNGAWYVVAPYLSSSYPLALAVFKATDPTSTWSEQDSTHHPLSTNNGSSKSADTLYSFDVVVQGNDLHMVWFYYNASASVYTPFYCKYSCATDTWTITQEQVSTASANGGYQISLATRSDGSVLVALGSPGHWYTRASGGGWTDQGAFYGSASLPQVVHCVTGANDRVHIFYATSGNNYLICHRSVESNNTLNSDQQNIGGGTNGAYQISPIAYLDGATTRLRVGCQWTGVSGSSYMAVLKADEGATPTWTVEEGGTTNAMAGPVALAHDGTTLYHVHTHSSDSSVTGQYQSSINNGGSWTPAGDTALNTSTGSTIYGHTANVYQRAGYVCLGYVYGGYTANSPPLTFVEVQLRQASVTASDSWSVSDAVTKAVNPHDAFSVSDGVARSGLVRSRTLADSYSVSDAVVRGLHWSRSISESWSVSESTTRGPFTRTRTGYVPNGFNTLVAAYNPSAYWRLGESGNARVAVDQAGSRLPNLVTNPLTNSASPDGWSPWWTGINGTIAMSGVVTPPNGSMSAVLTSTGVDVGAMSPFSPVDTQTTYTASWYFRSTMAATYTPYVGDGPTSWQVSGSSIAATANTWYRVTVTFQAGNTNPVVFRLYAAPTNLTGATIYFNSVQVVAQPNILPDPSFETSLGQWIASTATTTISDSPTQHRSGTSSMLMTGTGTKTTYEEVSAYYPASNGVRVAQYAFPASPGQIYTLSTWLYPTRLDPGSSNPQIQIFFFNASGALIQQSGASGTTALNAWQKITTTKTAPANTAYVGIGLYLAVSGSGLNGSTFTGYWDDIFLALWDGNAPPFYEGNGGLDGDYIGSMRPNLVANPSFESGTANWQSTADGTWINTGATLSSVATAPWIGSNCAQVTTTASPNYQGIAQLLSGSYLSGQPYTISVYLKGAVGGEAVQIGMGPTSGAGDNASTSPVLTTSWQRYSFTWTPTALETAAHLAIRSTNSAAITFFVDAVQITQTPNAVTYSDTQSLTPGQAGALGASGDSDAAVLFDGQFGYIKTPSVQLGSKIFSLSAWVNPNDLPAADRMIFGHTNGTGGFYLGNQFGLLNLWLYNSAGTQALQINASAANWGLNQWYHIVATYDGTTAKLYINGVLRGSGTTTTYADATPTPIYIGSSSPGSFFWAGLIDEPAVYNYALSPAQITALYNAGTSSTYSDMWYVQDSNSRTSMPFTRTTNDSVTVSDMVGLHFARTSADSYSVSDTASRSAGHPRSTADGYSVSDTAGRSSVIYHRSTSDSFTVSATTGGKLGSNRSATDTLSVSDSVSRTLGKQGRISDAWSISDSTAWRIPLTYHRTAADSFAVSEGIIGNFAVTNDGPINFTDAITPTHIVYGRALTDLWFVTDVAAFVGSHIIRTGTDSYTVSDAATWRLGGIRYGTDSWTLSESSTTTAMTPLMRQRWRINVLREVPSADSQMGNGSLFTILAGKPTQGSFGYGKGNWTQSIGEAVSDGGIFTWDLQMAATIRNTGLFSETPQ